MTKIRKQKRRQKYRYNVNRKRISKRKLVKPQSQIIKESWSNKFSCQQNLKSMGLVYDVNKEIKAGKADSKMDVDVPEAKPKAKVVEQLESEAKWRLSQRGYRLPKNQVEYLTYLLDTYGDDYKAMVKDKRNVTQATWKQLRAKINVFKNIPEQYNEYLAKKAKST